MIAPLDHHLSVPSRVSAVMEGISTYLTQFRAREELTQSEMASKLGLSLNRYREYEQNTTDNSKGISIELLIRIADLEKFKIGELLGRLLGESASTNSAVLGKQSQSTNQKLLDIDIELMEEYLLLPTADRKKFSEIVLQKVDSHESAEPLIPKKLKWLVRMGLILGQMPYAEKLKIERELIEEFLKKEDISEKEEFLDRLKDLVKFYYTNFDAYRK
jgi:transcriptional regulator with XRE-family HTH domain